MKLLRYSTLVLSIHLLTACGGGGESSSGTTTTPTPNTTITTTTLSGTVIAYGAVQGATVCLDKNNNLKCETSEPQATTNAQGQYSLTNINPGDSSSYLVIAIVPAGAKDSNQPVANAYTLTTPLGKHAVISPLTTVIHEDMSRFPGSPEQAAERVRYGLGFAKGIDLLTDYSPATNSDQKRLRNFGYAMSYTMADNMLKLKDSLPKYAYKSIYRIVAHNALTEYSRLRNYILDNTTQSAPLYYIQDYYLQRYVPLLESVHASSLSETGLFSRENMIFSPSHYVYDDCGLHNLPAGCDVPYKNSLIYHQIFKSTNNIVNGSSYSYSLSTGNTAAIDPSLERHTLELKNDAWVPTESQRTINSNNRVYAFDVSTYPIDSTLPFFLGNRNLYNSFSLAPYTFPPGSKFYFSQLMPNNAIHYLLGDNTTNDTTFDPILPGYADNYPVVNPTEINFSSLNDFIDFFTTHSLLISRHSTIGSKNNGQIESYSRIENITATFTVNGALYLKRWVGGTDRETETFNLPNGSWQIKRMGTRDLLFLTLPSNLANPQAESFYTVYNGQVVYGTSYAENEEYELFSMNGTAFNAIKAAIILDSAK